MIIERICEVKTSSDSWHYKGNNSTKTTRTVPPVQDNEDIIAGSCWTDDGGTVCDFLQDETVM